MKKLIVFLILFTGISIAQQSILTPRQQAMVKEFISDSLLTRDQKIDSIFTILESIEASQVDSISITVTETDPPKLQVNVTWLDGRISDLISDSLGAFDMSVDDLEEVQAYEPAVINGDAIVLDGGVWTIKNIPSMIQDSLQNADSVKSRTIAVDDGVNVPAIITGAGSVGGYGGINVKETVVVENYETSEGSPSFGFKIDGTTSDLHPPNPMTSGWDWSLPDKSGNIALTTDIGDSLVRMQDSIDTKTYADFGNYSSVTPTVDDVMVINPATESGSPKKTVLGDLPISSLTQAQLDQLTTTLNQQAILIQQLQEALFGSSIPVAPSNLSINGGIFVINLSWEHDETFVNEYEISRDTVNGSTWTVIDSVNSDVFTYKDSTDNGIIAGGTYKYRIRSLGTAGNSGYANFGSATVQFDEYLLTFNPANPTYEMDSTASFTPQVLDFETGDLGQFSSQVVNTGYSITASDTGVISDTYSALFVKSSGSNNFGYGRYLFEDWMDEVYVQFKVKDIRIPNSTSQFGASLIKLFNSSLSEVSNLSVSMEGTANDTRISRLRSPVNGTMLVADIDSLETYKIEIHYSKGTGSNGVCQIWVDDVLIRNVSNLSDTVMIRGIDIGFTGLGSRFNVYPSSLKIDDIIVSTSYIGDTPPTSIDPDSTVSIWAVNTSGSSIDITNLVIEDESASPIFSVNATTLSSLPITVADDDSVEIDIDVNRSLAGGTYSRTLTITTDFAIQTLGLQVELMGDEEPPPAPDPSTTWWVSNTGNGTQAGTDSLNATTLSGINSKNIQAGDTVLFIQGTYNTRFNPTKSGSVLGLVTYMANPTNTDSVWLTYADKAVTLSNLSYVRIKGIGIKNSTVGIDLRPEINVVYLDSLTIRKCLYSIYSLGDYSEPLHPSTSRMDSLFIRYSNIQIDSQVTAQTDGISVYGGMNSIFVIGNKIEQRNLIGGGHNDCIQFYNGLGDAVFANNIMTNYKTSSSQIFMNGSPFAGYKHILYNNIFAVYGAGVGIAYEGAWGNGGLSVDAGQIHMYHNTFYNNINNSHIHKTDSVYFWNNIATNFSPSSNQVMMWFKAGGVFDDDNFDYNLYYPAGGGSFVVYLDGSGSKTLTQWRATPYFADIQGAIGNPLFESTSDFRLQAGSPALNMGANLQSLIESFGLDWTIMNNRFVTGATGTVRTATPNVGVF